MTASADMTRLLTDVTVKYPGVMMTDAQAKLYAVANEFLAFSNLWYEDVSFDLVVGQNSYTLTLAEVPPGRIARLVALYDSQDVRLPDIYWCDRARLTLPNGLTIYTTPSTVKTWVARVAKIIADVDADNNPALPDWVIQRYRDDLLAGIQRDLCLEVGKPWSNPTMGAFWGKTFLQAKARARVDAIKSNVLGQTNWAYPQSFGRGTQRGV